MKTSPNLCVLIILSTLTLLLLGCGEKLPPGMPRPVPCEVVVIQNDQPLTGAVVRLVHANNAEWDSLGRTDTSGKATFYTLDRYKGAVPGKYKVVVSKTETEQPAQRRDKNDTTLVSYQLVQEQFGMASTTPLEIEVVKGTPTHTIDVGKAVRIITDDKK